MVLGLLLAAQASLCLWRAGLLSNCGAGFHWGFQVPLGGGGHLAMQETKGAVSSLGREDPLEECTWASPVFLVLRIPGAWADHHSYKESDTPWRQLCGFSCGEWGWALGFQMFLSSGVQAQWWCRPAAPGHVGPSQFEDWGCVTCPGRWIHAEPSFLVAGPRSVLKAWLYYGSIFLSLENPSGWCCVLSASLSEKFWYLLSHLKGLLFTWAALGLCCCTWAFCAVSLWGYSLVVVQHRLLIVVAFSGGGSWGPQVRAQQLWCMGCLVTLTACESSWTRIKPMSSPLQVDS